MKTQDGFEGDLEEWWWGLKDTRLMVDQADPLQKLWNEERAEAFGQRLQSWVTSANGVPTGPKREKMQTLKRNWNLRTQTS